MQKNITIFFSKIKGINIGYLDISYNNKNIFLPVYDDSIYPPRIEVDINTG